MSQVKRKPKFEDFYEKKDLIAFGATGKVYKCISKEDRRPYAVKVCPASEMRACLRVKKEIKICRLLDHDNIVKLIQSFEGLYDFHIVFEMMEGGDVCDDIVNRDKYTEYDASILIEQVLKGVAYIHTKFIIHRDLKPENLLLRRKDGGVIVKITDFGSAVQSYVKVNDFSLMMTTSYGAPEIFFERPYWLPIDIWSCGVILYVALLGIEPFGAETPEEEMEKIKRGHYTFPDDKNCEPICDEAKSLISELLKLDENERSTANEALSHPFINHRDCVASRVHRSRTIENMKVFNKEKRSKSETLLQPWRVPLNPPPQSKSDGAISSHTIRPGETEPTAVEEHIKTDGASCQVDTESLPPKETD